MNPKEEIKQENNVPVPPPVVPVKNTVPAEPVKPQESRKGTPGNDLFIRPLRTYEDDVKNAVQKDGITTSRILLAEQQKRQVEQEDFEENSPKSESNIVKISASIILILLGIGVVGGGAYYYIQKKAADVPQQVTILTSNNFLDTEEIVKINVANKTNREVVGEIRKTMSSSGDMKEDTLKEIKLTKTVITTENGKEFSDEVNLNTEEFMNILEAREPDALTRSLDSKFLLGIHKTKAGVEPFILFRTNDYEISYAKMLEWEWVLVPDIQDIFYKNLGSSQAFIKYEEDFNDNVPLVIDKPLEGSTTPEIVPTFESGTSTAPKYEYRNFKDLILANRDTRSIVSADDKTLFFYSFIDRKNIILTTNIDTMNMAISRINSAKLVR